MKSRLTLIFPLALLGFLSCHGQETVKKLQPDNFEMKLNAAPAKILLDVRTQEEFNRGHLANATLLDYYRDDFKAQLKKLDNTRPVFVYCGTGPRSTSASKILADLGFKEIYELQGGFKAWNAARKPITK